MRRLLVPASGLLLALCACGGSDGGGTGVQITPSLVPVTISAQPAATSVNADQPVVLSVTAAGTGPLSYQWRKGGVAVAGAVGATFTISRATPADAGSYDVVVSNAGGSINSAAAAVTVTTIPVGITRQPTDRTAAAGFPISFAIQASGTGLTYQWKRDGTAIPGATSGTLTLPTASIADDQARFTVEVSNATGTLASRTAILSVLTLNPTPVNYVSFDNRTIPLYAWEGKRVALLTTANTLSYPAVAALLGALDSAYIYYELATGFTPGSGKSFNNKLSIAQVATTCGAGCGFIGARGIELSTATFDTLYTGVLVRDEYDQAVFYEFGRNFWNLTSRLTYRAPDSDVVTTGFAVFMRFMAMNNVGVAGGPFGSWTFADFRMRVEQMVDLYHDDTTQTFDNTLKIGRAQANNPSQLGATDLFASICLRLARDNGGEVFVRRLWTEAARRRMAQTTQDAVDNFVVAASIAANRNLAPVFITRWRWPVSAAAQAEVARLPA